jgi:hypothetical protein
MSDDAGMTRREFLLLSAGAGVAWLLRSTLPWSQPGAISNQWALSLHLTALLRHRESARIIGREYLRQYPHESDTQMLAGLIATACGGCDAPLLEAAEKEPQSLLEQTLRRDFEAEKVVKIQGWILSTTEARLCALAALI